jgi:hypothetical protein
MQVSYNVKMEVENRDLSYNNAMRYLPTRLSQADAEGIELDLLGEAAPFLDERMKKDKFCWDSFKIEQTDSRTVGNC